MADLDNFEKLVSGLTLEERQVLLERLKGQTNFSKEPLYVQNTEPQNQGTIEEGYERLPWYYRLWFFFIGFFRSKSPIEIFGEKQVAILGRRIDDFSPGMYNYQKRMLLPLFYQRIGKLKEASRFFYTALDSSVNRDRYAFFAFLASLEMPEIHKYLQNETDPEIITEKNPGISNSDLRLKALAEVDKAMDMITDENRTAMYFNVRTLFCLKQLSSFLFDRILTSFSIKPGEEGESCSINIVRELLENLNNVLFSLKAVPPLTLLESLFIFVVQDKSEENGFDINMELNNHISKAENAISVIRQFNKTVPLTWIIRCISRSFSPREISGGEDWLLIFKEFWKKRADTLCNEFLMENRQRELLKSSRDFLKDREFRMLEYVQSDSNTDGFPLEKAFTISLLLSFHMGIFMPDMNKSLYSFLNNGKFNRKEHWGEFTDSYNKLLNLEVKIKKFEIELSPEGDFGRRYLQARQDMSSIPLKRRKIQLVLEEAAEEADIIIKEAVDASNSMVNILLAANEKDPVINENIMELQKLLNLLDDMAIIRE